MFDDGYGLWPERRTAEGKATYAGQALVVCQVSNRPPVASMEPMTSRQVVNSWCFPPVNFLPPRAPLSAKPPCWPAKRAAVEPARMCIRASLVIGLRMPRIFAANRPGRRDLSALPRPATRQGKAADGPLTSFLSDGCAIGHLWQGASGLRPEPPNAQTGVRSQLRSQPCQKRTWLVTALLSRPWHASQSRNLSEVQI